MSAGDELELLIRRIVREEIARANGKDDDEELRSLAKVRAARLRAARKVQ